MGLQRNGRIETSIRPSISIGGCGMREWIQALEPRRLLSASPYSGPLQVVPDLSPAQQLTYTGNAVYGLLATLEGVSDAQQLKPNQLPRAVVRWGDGSAAQRLNVSAFGATSIGAVTTTSHHYRHTGTFAIKIAFYFHGRRLGEVVQMIKVDQNSAGGTTIRAIVGQQFTQVLGTVPTASTASEQYLGANWGDGSFTGVTVQNNNGTTEQIVSSHVYKRPGVYRILVTEPSSNFEVVTIGPIVFSTAIVARR